MVSAIANLNALVHGARKAAAVQVASALAASKAKQAPAAATGPQSAPVPPRREAARLASGLLDVLIHAQADPAHADHGRHLGHTKKPKPQPAPAPTPTPAPPPLVVRDDPVPAIFLGRVLESLHARPESQFSSEPFSQRDRPVAPSPEAVQALGGAFYSPGAFRPVQAMAMRSVHQGQAALALLQAGALGVNRLI